MVRAPMPRRVSSRRLSSLMVTCATGGPRVAPGGRRTGPLPGQVVVVEDGGAPGQGRRPPRPGRPVEGEGEEVLHHHQVGRARAPSTSARVGRPSASMASPGTVTSTGPRAGHRVRCRSRARRGRAATWRPRWPRRRSPRGGRREGRRWRWRHRTGVAPRSDRPAPVGVPSVRARRRHHPPRADRRPAGRPRRPGPDPDHQPPGAPQRHDLGRHRRPAPRAGPGQGRPRRPGGGPGRSRRPGLLRRRRPVGHGADGPRRDVRRVPRPPPRPGLAGPAVRGDVALGKPTIARVQGWAMAGGFGLALACDMVVASEQRPVRGPRAQRRPLALHGDRLRCCARCPRRRPWS